MRSQGYHWMGVPQNLGTSLFWGGRQEDPKSVQGETPLCKPQGGAGPLPTHLVLMGFTCFSTMRVPDLLIAGGSFTLPHQASSPELRLAFLEFAVIPSYLLTRSARWLSSSCHSQNVCFGYL